MLVLERFEKECIFIDGDTIIIKILEIIPIKNEDTFKVRMGITAPKNISVHREEIYGRLKKSGRDQIVKKEKSGNR